MTDAQATGSQECFRLIYRSRDQIPAENRKAVLGDLFTEARSNNKAAGISGALLVSGDWFVQTLEGDETAVTELFSRIRADTRHDHVTVIQSGMVPVRVFQRWSMARVGDEGGPDVNLIAHKDGIHSAAPRPKTGEQDYLLYVMREATRGEMVDS